MRVGSPGKVTGAGATSTIRRVVCAVGDGPKKDFPSHESGQCLAPDEICQLGEAYERGGNLIVEIVEA